MQASDILVYEGQDLALKTSWAYPSPLETYYSSNNAKSAFETISTGNYRGHIAHWIIENKKLYLSKVSVGKSINLPSYYDIKFDSQKSSSSGAIFAEWFSGVIAANYFKYTEDERNFVATYYFHVRKGKIVSQNKISKEDFNLLRNNKAEIVSPDLVSKKEILELFQSYTDYHFRLSNDDTIIVDGKNARLRSDKGMSPLLDYFNNDHLRWPFNWENRTVNGAPNGHWLIRNSKVYLSKVELYSGSNIYTIDSTPVGLSEIFNSGNNDKHVFADWLSGVLLIVYGHEETDSIGYSTFVEEEHVYIRLEKGEVKESYSVDAKLNFDEVMSHADEGLIQIYKDWNKLALN